MSIYIYDKAIIEKFKEILGDPRISIVPFESAFRRSGVDGDDVTLPFVSISRQGWSLTQHTKNITAYMVGKPKTKNDVYYTNAYLPIEIQYNIDITTRNREENDELCRELILYIHRHPELIAEVTYLGITQRFGFHWFLGNDVVDNSEISEFENRGQYYRSTLSMVVDEAQLIYVEKYVPVKEIQIKFIAQEVTETYPPIETITNISLPVSLEKGNKD